MSINAWQCAFTSRHKEDEMVRTLIARGVGTLFLGLAIAGCSRGIFIGDTCGSGPRESVHSDAASAVYLDKDGNPVGNRAELLKDTRTSTPKNIAVNNVMCAK